MSRIAYVNGRYLAHSQASVHVEDRGYQFGDGIYEVVLVVNGQPVDYDGHLERLYKSLNSIRMDAPISCLLYTSPSPRDRSLSRMPSSA